MHTYAGGCDTLTRRRQSGGKLSSELTFGHRRRHWDRRRLPRAMPFAGDGNLQSLLGIRMPSSERELVISARLFLVLPQDSWKSDIERPGEMTE